MDGNVITLPTSRERPALAQVEATEERLRVEVTACLTGYRVWLLGRPYHDFVSLSNASRCASALMVLDALGCLPTPPEPPQAA